MNSGEDVSPRNFSGNHSVNCKHLKFKSNSLVEKLQKKDRQMDKIYLRKN